MVSLLVYPGAFLVSCACDTGHAIPPASSGGGGATAHPMAKVTGVASCESFADNLHDPSQSQSGLDVRTDIALNVINCSFNESAVVV